MKKIFSLFAAVLFAGSMMAGEAVFKFDSIADANSWVNGTAYTTVTISPVTLTALGGGNNGKYYSSNKSWRFYNGGSLEVTVAEGKVTAVSSTPAASFEIDADGKAVYTDGGAKANFTAITVTYKLDSEADIPATAIELNKTELSLEQYREEELIATVTPNNTTSTITWTSSEPTVATVAAGVVKAIGVGTTIITVKAGESVSATCEVTVSAATVLTCAQAAEMAATLANNNDRYAGGQYVVEGYAISMSNNNYIWIADDKDAAEGTFEIYLPTNKSEISSVTKGDKIRAHGYITKYNTNYEFAAGCVFEVIPDTPTAIDNAEAEVKAIKRFENGVLIIEKNGVKYNAQGAVVR